MNKQFKQHSFTQNALPQKFQLNKCIEDQETHVTKKISRNSKKIQRKSSKLPKNKSKNLVYNFDGKISGHWTQKQNLKYYIFLENHYSQFQFQSLRRTEKIFKLMSNFIQTRAPGQCRSHHQKMQMKVGKFSNIMNYLRVIWNTNQLDIKQLQKKLHDLECFQQGSTQMQNEQIYQSAYECQYLSEMHQIPNVLQPLYNL